MKKIKLICTSLFFNFGLLIPVSAQYFFYDNFNRLTSLILKDGSTTIYTYDKLGNRLSQTVTGNSIALHPKVFLQGTYNSGAGKMNDQLRSLHLLPETEPFSTLGMTLLSGAGSKVKDSVTVFSDFNDNSVVDWIMVQLRDKNNLSNVLYSQPFLLQRDGDVVGLDGVSPVVFGNVPADEYYVVVRHRNHLGVMTATPVLLSAVPVVLNFTDGSTPAYGSNAMKNLGNGKWGLWAGNANSNPNVRYSGPANDQNKLLNICLGGNKSAILNDVYDTCDLNMDGKVRYSGPANDQNMLLNLVLGGNKTAIINQNF